MALGGRNPLAMEVAAEETVCTYASVTALGGRPPTGVGPPLRGSLPGDGQEWPPDDMRSYLARQPTPAQSVSPGRRVLQQRQVHLTPSKGGSSTTAPAVVARLPYGKRSRHAHQQLIAPSQPKPIHLQLIFIQLPFAIPLPLPENLHFFSADSETTIYA